MEKKLDVKQAFFAMYLFMDHLYDLTKDKSLPVYLSSMQLLEDGLPADRAYWEDWINAVQKALEMSKG